LFIIHLELLLPGGLFYFNKKPTAP